MAVPRLEDSAVPPAPPTGAKSNIFISYSRKDEAFVGRLAAALRERDIAPLLDRTEITISDDWWQRIEASICAADAIVFVLSPDSIVSDICLKEVDFALGQRKRLAPIVCRPIARDRVPEEVAKLHSVDFDDPEKFDPAIAELVEALSTDIGWRRKHTAFGLDAQAWDGAGQPKGLLLRSPRLEEAEDWLANRPENVSPPTELTQSFIRQSKRASVRLRSIVIGSLSGGLVLAFALAAFAFWQRDIAVEQTRKAQQNFSTAKKAADNVIINLVKNLREVRGVTQEMALIVLPPVEAIMNELVANSEDNPELQLSRIALYEELARTYWFVGDVGAARKSISQGLELSDRLLASTSDPRKRIELLEHRHDSFRQQADILRVHGDVEDFLASFRKAKEAVEGIVKLKPDDQAAWRRLASIMGRIGDVERTSGRFVEAAREYAEVERIQQGFLKEKPDDPDWLGELSWTHNRVGDNLLRIVNHESLMTVSADRRPVARAPEIAAAALRRYESSVRIRRGLVARFPRSSEHGRNLAWSMALNGMALLSTDTRQARALLEEGLADIGQLQAQDRKNAESRRYRALLCNFLGDALLLEDRRPEAVAKYEEALALRQALADDDASNGRWWRDLFYTLVRMSEVHAIMAKADEARRYRQRALELADRVVQKFPADGALTQAIARLRDGQIP